MRACLLILSLGSAAAQAQTCQKTANAATCEVLCANGATFDLSPLHKPGVPYEVKDFDAVEGLADASLANYSYVFNICGEVASVRCVCSAGCSAVCSERIPPSPPLSFSLSLSLPFPAYCAHPFVRSPPSALCSPSLVLSPCRCRAPGRTVRPIRAKRRKATWFRRPARRCSSLGWRQPSKSRTGTSLATICATGWARRRRRPRCSGRSSKRAIRLGASR